MVNQHEYFKTYEKKGIKLFTVIIVYTIQILSIFAQSPSFEYYMNPVIPGDHPDATLTRIGNDYYTTGSSFNVTPVIYHSTDLVHWEAIAQPVKASWSNYGDGPGGGCWGGHMVYYNNKYWHFFSRANTMYFVTADDPMGHWSDPVRMNNPSSLSYSLGYDNSIFIDDDNKWYLCVKNGQPNGAIVELGNDGQPDGAIYNLDWLNPSPDYPYSWAEGPVMWKYEGYYYYSFARDLAGGQKVMRSTMLTDNKDSWEMLGDFFNENDPQKPGSLFTSPNHASPVITLDDSTFWIIHPLYAKGEWKGQGRQGLLNQVRYDANLKPVADYPVNKSFTAPKLPSSGIPWMVPKSDFFNSDKFDPEWSFLGYTLDDTYSLTYRTGWLRLSPKTSQKANTITKNDGEHNYSLITRMEFNPETLNDQSGLWIMRGDETMFVKLYSSVNDLGRRVVVFSFNKIKYEADNTIGNTLWLKIIRVNHSISGYFSSNGNEWIQVGQNFDVSVIDSYSDFSTFTGTRQGLYVQGKEAFFDLYIYRDAYTPILAECTANQYGTFATTKSDGIYHLDSIHNNDWALYAGVEFGNDEYLKIPKSVEFTATSASSGGTIEVWLDSIDTGIKIADCEISNTGDWNNFETFTPPVDSVKGRHDIYLRFKGTDAGRLFKLKWINFIPDIAPEFILANIENENILQLKLSQPVVIQGLPSGLNIIINESESVPISNISQAQKDSSLLNITLDTVIKNTDKLTVSYTQGKIINQAGISLMPFTDFQVNNALPDAVPEIKLIEAKNEGDTIWMYLSKKMKSPAQSVNEFIIHVEGKENILIKSADLIEGDSTTIILIPESRIYYEDYVTLSYSGINLEAGNGGILASFSSQSIQNTTNGYPLSIVSVALRQSGKNYNLINMKFDKPLYPGSGKESFIITLNEEPVEIRSFTVDYDSIIFSVYPYIQYGDEIKISYSGGSVRSHYNGILENFADFEVSNTIPNPETSDQDNNKLINAQIKNIHVFPNPAQSELQVCWDNIINKLEILSITGETVIQKKYNSPEKKTLLIVDLIPGIYILKLSNEFETGIAKIIIK